ncbi:MAG: FecR domain-containing protein [Hyphomicrobiaceae bacterium]
MAAAEPEVGAAVLIKKQVTGTLGTTERQIETGARVHRNELIRTGPEAQAELKLDDDTKLALGPDSELRLDEYAVGSGSSAPSIGLKFIKGTLRFLTGKSASLSYKIETPAATIGVRGTIFDVYVAPSGDTFVLIHKGKVEVCSEKGTCQGHRTVGRVVQATALGVVSQPMKWSAKLARGVGVAQAFPFVGQKLVIDPVPRSHHKAISDDLKVLEDGGRTIERTLKKVSPF